MLLKKLSADFRLGTCCFASNLSKDDFDSISISNPKQRFQLFLKLLNFFDLLLGSSKICLKKKEKNKIQIEILGFIFHILITDDTLSQQIKSLSCKIIKFLPSSKVKTEWKKLTVSDKQRILDTLSL